MSDNRGRFTWHELLTTDTAAAAKFYSDVVGWRTMESPNMTMPYTLWTDGQVPKGGLMKLPKEASDMGSPPSWLGYIEVPDVDATQEQITKLGGKVLMPAMTVEQAGRFAVMADPQGAVFGILKSAMDLGDETDPKPLEFSWHELATDDLAGAIKFYEAVFGWKKVSEFDMGDMGVYHMFGRDRFTYGGMMKKSPGMPASYWLHYIAVKDTADAATERATKGGAKVMVGPMEVPGGDRITVMTDPQGAAFAVHSKPQK